MRKIAILAVLGVFVSTLALFPTVAYAVNSENDVNKVTKSGNEYKTSEEELKIDNDIRGDLFAAAETLYVDGEIGDNLFAAAGGIVVNGDVRNDVFLAGAYIVINGDIRGDVKIAGGEVYINSDLITGDVMVMAGKLSVADEVEILGEKEVYSGMLSEGVVDNPVDLSGYNPESNKVMFGDKEYNFDSSGVVTLFTGAGLVMGFFWKLLMLASMILAGYLVLRLFPVLTETTLGTMNKAMVKSTLLGMGVYVVAPLVALVLLFSLIGFKVLVLLAMLGGLCIYLSGVYSSYAVGRWILVMMGNEKTGRAIPLALGMFVVELTLFIFGLLPFIGWLLVFVIRGVLYSWATGALVLNKYRSMQTIKPKKK